METQLRFLLTRVKFGSQMRLQVWFAKKFLRVPERETVLTDIVRFICSVRPSGKIRYLIKMGCDWLAINVLQEELYRSKFKACVVLGLAFL